MFSNINNMIATSNFWFMVKSNTAAWGFHWKYRKLSINRSINQSINQSVSQSINQSINYFGERHWVFVRRAKVAVQKMLNLSYERKQTHVCNFDCEIWITAGYLIHARDNHQTLPSATTNASNIVCIKWHSASGVKVIPIVTSRKSFLDFP